MEIGNHDVVAPEKGPSTFLNIIQETFLSSPFNIFLTIVCGFLIYRLMRTSSPRENDDPDAIKLPEPLKKHDMDLEELKKYDGKGPDGRVCISINGLVFDCSKSHFYRPGGPYASFAGRDATRGLAKFDVTAVSDEWDDHVDLTPSEISSVQEWEMQFRERYEIVGKLVKDLSVTERKDDKEEKENNDGKESKESKANVSDKDDKNSKGDQNGQDDQGDQADQDDGDDNLKSDSNDSGHDNGR